MNHDIKYEISCSRRTFLKGLFYLGVVLAGVSGCGNPDNVMKIVTYPDPILRKISLPIENIDDAIISLSEGIMATVGYYGVAGLAAPQVGVLKRLIVCDLSYGTELMVNPEIRERRGEVYFSEGCSSLPSYPRENIKRSKFVKVSYEGLDSKKMFVEAMDFDAVVLQHEIDHLDGKLYIDYVKK